MKEMHIIRYADDLGFSVERKRRSQDKRSGYGVDWREVEIRGVPWENKDCEHQKTVVRVSWIQNKGKVEAS